MIYLIAPRIPPGQILSCCHIYLHKWAFKPTTETAKERRQRPSSTFRHRIVRHRTISLRHIRRGCSGLEKDTAATTSDLHLS